MMPPPTEVSFASYCEAAFRPYNMSSNTLMNFESVAHHNHVISVYMKESSKIVDFWLK